MPLTTHQKLIKREEKLINYIDQRYNQNWQRRETLRAEVAIRSLLLIGLLESEKPCMNDTINYVTTKL